MLTVLAEKLGEAHGLAMAATAVTVKVAERLTDDVLRGELAQLGREAEETRARCLEVGRTRGGELGGEILSHAHSTRNKAADLAGVWLKAGTGPLSAWGFLAMGEAAEVSVWSALAALARKAGERDFVLLAERALPVQERHLRVALD